MSRRLSILLAASSILALAQDAKPSIDGTLDLLYQKNQTLLGPEGRQVSLERQNQYQGALSLFMNWGKWSAGLTLRDVNFYKIDTNTTLPKADIALYRAYVKYASDGLSVQLGDFNTMLGRGMVLSVIQNDTIVQDWTVRGGDVHYQWNWLDVHALAGTVSNNCRKLDGTLLPPAPNKYQKWKVTGLEGSAEWLSGNRVGLRVSTIDDDVADPSPLLLVRPSYELLGRRTTESVSLSGNNLMGILDYYAEAAQLTFDQPKWILNASATDPKRGSGAYGNMVLHTNGLMMMGEYKHYRHFDNQLNNAPLADRETEKNNLDNSDGYRLLTQYSFHEPDLTLFFSVGHCEEGALMLPLASYVGSNVYGGFKLEGLFDRLDASGTYGQKSVHNTAPYTYLQKKTDGTLTYRMTPVWSLDFTYRARWKDRSMDTYHDSDITCQLGRSPLGAIFFTHQGASARDPFDNPDGMRSGNNGGFRFNFGKGSFLELSGGSFRGGEVCSGGQCVQMPSFRGFKAATHIRF